MSSRGLRCKGLSYTTPKCDDGMKRDKCNSLVETISKLPCCNDIGQFPLPLDGGPPIEGLQIFSGYRCKYCEDVKTQSEVVIKRHIFDKHPLYLSCREEAYESVSLQTWGVNRRKYWTVTTELNEALNQSASGKRSVRPTPHVEGPARKKRSVWPTSHVERPPRKKRTMEKKRNTPPKFLSMQSSNVDTSSHSADLVSTFASTDLDGPNHQLDHRESLSDASSDSDLSSIESQSGYGRAQNGPLTSGIPEPSGLFPINGETKANLGKICAEAEAILKHTHRHYRRVSEFVSFYKYLKARCVEAESRALEAEEANLNAQTTCARAEQALELARTVQARELERLKKESEDSEKMLRKQVDELTMQKDDLQRRMDGISRFVDLSKRFQ